jgi:hypothetical protein
MSLLYQNSLVLSNADTLILRREKAQKKHPFGRNAEKCCFTGSAHNIDIRAVIQECLRTSRQCSRLHPPYNSGLRPVAAL